MIGEWLNIDGEQFSNTWVRGDDVREDHSFSVGALARACSTANNRSLVEKGL
jgi:hypothetical protein